MLDMDKLALCLSTGVLDVVLEISSNAQLLFNWLLRLGELPVSDRRQLTPLALGDASTKLDTIRSTLVYLLHKYKDVARDFVSSKWCLSLFASMDVNPILVSQHQDNQEYVVNINRELAASLICDLVTAVPE